MPYVTDTHSLVWHMTGDSRLSVKARRVFEEVDKGGNYISIPCIIFFELLYLVEKKKLTIDFENFIAMVSSSRNYKIEPLCLPIIEKSRMIPREKVADPWDRLIAATSTYLNFPLITQDEALKKIGLDVVW
ncbi:MAG: type II toxin-antitoxin system VapC family toxin [Candidatus Aerophobetes bacterium]|nr:type II toxin-antitoxin system VapC family toxin [Candidatus Aerophobetes bacterium]